MKTLALTADRLRELLSYNPETGEFVWRSPRSNFNVGKPAAGTRTCYGYEKICVDHVQYRAHRLAWLYVHGAWPSDQIDHKNGIRHDNRIANLREATPAQNQQNRRPVPNEASGVAGIQWEPDRKKWRVNVRANNVIHRIGRFDCLDKAKAAHAEAKARLHPFALRGAA